VNRDSGTDSANGGWLRRLVRLHFVITHLELSTQAFSTSRTKKTGNCATLPTHISKKWSCPNKNSESFTIQANPAGVGCHTKSNASGNIGALTFRTGALYLWMGSHIV
jgi:hypothetical protein